MKRGDVVQQSEMESGETGGFQESNLSDTQKMWIKIFEPVEYGKLGVRETSRDWVDARFRRLVTPKSKLSPTSSAALRSSRGPSQCKNAEACITYLFHAWGSDGSSGHMKYICKSCGIGEHEFLCGIRMGAVIL